MQIDHVTIRTTNLAATRSFFETVFDLIEVDRPLAIRRIAGHWLASEGRPVVHLIRSGRESGRRSIMSASGSRDMRISSPSCDGSA